MLDNLKSEVSGRYILELVQDINEGHLIKRRTESQGWEGSAPANALTIKQAAFCTTILKGLPSSHITILKTHPLATDGIIIDGWNKLHTLVQAQKKKDINPLALEVLKQYWMPIIYIYTPKAQWHILEKSAKLKLSPPL